MLSNHQYSLLVLVMVFIITGYSFGAQAKLSIQTLNTERMHMNNVLANSINPAVLRDNQQRSIHKQNWVAQNRMQSQTSDRTLTLSEAIAIAKRRHQGEVLSAKKVIGKQGRLVYRIKILTDKGVVKIVRIPAVR